MSNSAILKSSLAKKYWMAATGLFLCVFLLGHLAGNFQLFIIKYRSTAKMIVFIYFKGEIAGKQKNPRYL